MPGDLIIPSFIETIEAAVGSGDVLRFLLISGDEIEGTVAAVHERLVRVLVGGWAVDLLLGGVTGIGKRL